MKKDFHGIESLTPQVKKLIPTALALSLALALVLATIVLQSGTSAAEGPVEIGADADASGNEKDALGTRDSCVSVNQGDTFDLDIYVTDVDALAHWELYFTFDPSIVRLVEADTRMFLTVTTGSSVKGQVDRISDGQHFLGAADLRDAAEDGAGVLARLTFEAVGPGVSEAHFLYDDVNGDGRDDKGPRLTDSEGNAIGDNTGDGVFDSAQGASPYDALIAVNESCPVPVPTPTPTPTPTPDGDTPIDEDPPDGVDDDGDTLIDEDPRDGVDNDADTLIDEDPQGEIDNDGDTLIDEDPVDGVDNDGDTAIDEDPLDGAADSGEVSEPVVLAGEGTPIASDSAGAGPALGGDSSPPSSSSGGLPIWAILLIAAAVLVTATGGSVFLVARSGGRFGP